MADQNADNVIFHNNGGFACSFSIQWSGGESGRTSMTSLGESVSMNLNNVAVPSGASCCARAYVQGGPNHDSGRNFNYVKGGGTVQYTISGGTLNPSFD